MTDILSKELLTLEEASKAYHAKFLMPGTMVGIGRYMNQVGYVQKRQMNQGVVSIFYMKKEIVEQEYSVNKIIAVKDLIPDMKHTMTYKDMEDLFNRVYPLSPTTRLIGSFAKLLGYDKRRVMNRGARTTVYTRNWRKPPLEKWGA